jgi:hypothetical protein
MLTNEKTIRVVYDFEPENQTEMIALGDLVGVSIYNAIKRFRVDDRPVEECIRFFQKIDDVANISDLLKGD